MENLKARTVRAGFARILAQAASLLLRILSLVVMSRLLDPRDFGLMAMVTAVTGVYALFTTAGLSAATIQQITVSEKQLSTLFWINVAVGAMLAALCVATAPILVRFFHENRLFWITVAVSAGFIFNAAGVQHGAILERQLRYFELSSIAVLSHAAGVGLAIAMAIAGFGYWALVATVIVPPALSTACAWVVTGWIPGLPHRQAGIRRMLHFGGTITLNYLIVYLAYNSEKILLGRSWGADVLGLYGRAYQLVNIPTASLNEAVGAVAFSALSRLQQDPLRLRNYFLRGYSLVISLTLPTTIFSAVWADDIVLVLLGSKWVDAAAIFRFLSPTILIFGVINPLAWLMTSTGLQGRSLRIALVIAPLVFTAYLIGLPYGPTGVALSFSVTMTLWLVPHVLWCVHGTVVSARDLAIAVSRPLLSGIVAAGLTLGSQFALAQVQPPQARLAAGGLVMLATYAFMLLFVMGQWKFYLDLFSDVFGWRGRGRALQK
jgi:PST family polysaccharide transporter